MKRVFTALTLCSALALSPQFAKAQEFGNAEGGFDSSSNISPSDFLEQADGCPYAAMAMYQQHMNSRQQQSLAQSQQASRSADVGYQQTSMASTSRPIPNPVVANSARKHKKKKPTAIASSSARSRKGAATLATGDATSQKTPRPTTRPSSASLLTDASIDSKLATRSRLAD